MINPDDEKQADEIVDLLSTTEEERKLRAIVEFLQDIVMNRATMGDIMKYYKSIEE